GKTAVDLEDRGQVRQLPLVVGQQRDLDARTRQRRAQIPRVVGDAAPAAGLDHERLHRGHVTQDEPSERSRRTQADSFSRRLAARRGWRGGYLTTSAAMRARAPAATAARRIAAAPRPWCFSK